MTRTKGLATLLCLLGLAVLPGQMACDSGGGDSGGGDSDSDSDGDSDGDMCADYPTSDNDFVVGDVLRNYAFYDGADAETELCQYADRELALLVISGGES